MKARLATNIAELLGCMFLLESMIARSIKMIKHDKGIVVIRVLIPINIVRLKIAKYP